MIYLSVQLYVPFRSLTISRSTKTYLSISAEYAANFVTSKRKVQKLCLDKTGLPAHSKFS